MGELSCLGRKTNGGKAFGGEWEFEGEMEFDGKSGKAFSILLALTFLYAILLAVDKLMEDAS